MAMARQQGAVDIEHQGPDPPLQQMIERQLRQGAWGDPVGLEQLWQGAEAQGGGSVGRGGNHTLSRR